MFLSGMSDEQLREMEGEERKNVEARIECLRNINRLLDAAMIQISQYMAAAGPDNYRLFTTCFTIKSFLLDVSNLTHIPHTCFFFSTKTTFFPRVWLQILDSQSLSGHIWYSRNYFVKGYTEF